MSDIENDASLKGKIRHVAKEHGLKSQEVLQMYLFEHLLMRLERSEYTNNFVLKGGLLIASLTGIFQRTTMDMDTTVIGMGMDEGTVTEALQAICSVDCEDGMEYELEKIEPIREDDEYANWRAHIRARYGKIDAPIKVDITTGDAIYPDKIRYRYDLMFDQGALEVLSYPLSTVLAEKLETVLRRGIANTRGRDFYDLYILDKLRFGEIDAEELRGALLSTAEKRGSIEALSDREAIISEIRESDAMRGLWDAYVADTPYAEGISLEDALKSAERIAKIAGF